MYLRGALTGSSFLLQIVQAVLAQLFPDFLAHIVFDIVFISAPFLAPFLAPFRLLFGSLSYNYYPFHICMR